MNSQAEAKPIPWETSFRYDAFVIGLFVLALVAGLGLKTWALTRATISADLDFHLSLSYPAMWTRHTEKGTLLSIRDLQSEGTFKVSFSVAARQLEPPATGPVQDLVQPHIAERGEGLTAFRVLKTGETTVDGLAAAEISYAYVDDAPWSPLQTSLPVVVQGIDILVVRDTDLYVFTFAAPAPSFAQQAETLEAILRSVQFQPAE
jgi:hypothetical protein